jgi:hypothetical protein
MATIVTITHPSSGRSLTLTGGAYDSLEFGGAMDSGGALSLNLPARALAYSDETSALNPVQRNALITVDRHNPAGTLERKFKGFIQTVTRRLTGNLRGVSITAGGMEAKLQRTLVGMSCDGTFVRTGKLAYTADNLVKPTGDYCAELCQLCTTLKTIGIRTSTKEFYPLPSYANGWRVMTGGLRAPYTTLGDDLDSAATEALSATAADEGFRPFGIIRLTGGGNTEYAAYEGFDLDATLTVRQFNTLVRGCLGTSAEDFSDGDAVDAMIPLRISDSVEPVLWGYTAADGASDAAIDPSNYEVHYEDGAFLFSVNPLTTDLTPPLLFGGVATLPEKILANYRCYEENDAAALVLGGDDSAGIIEQILVLNTGDAGPGLTSSDWDVDLRRLVVPQFYLSAPSFSLPAIRDLLDRYAPDTLGTRAGVTHYHCGFWYEATTGKFVVRGIEQSATPTRLKGVSEIVEDCTLADASSAVLVTYEDSLGVTRCELVSLTDTYSSSGDGHTVLDAAAYAKLVDDGFGMHSVGDVINAGQVEYGRALALARNTLERGLVAGLTRVYTLRGREMTIPLIGETVKMPDGFTGVVLSWHLGQRNNVETLTLRVCDFTRRLA